MIDSKKEIENELKRNFPFKFRPEGFGQILSIRYLVIQQEEKKFVICLYSPGAGGRLALFMLNKDQLELIQLGDIYCGDHDSSFDYINMNNDKDLFIFVFFACGMRKLDNLIIYQFKDKKLDLISPLWKNNKSFSKFSGSYIVLKRDKKGRINIVYNKPIFDKKGKVKSKKLHKYYYDLKNKKFIENSEKIK